MWIGRKNFVEVRFRETPGAGAQVCGRARAGKLRELQSADFFAATYGPEAARYMRRAIHRGLVREAGRGGCSGEPLYEADELFTESFTLLIDALVERARGVLAARGFHRLAQELANTPAR